MACCFSAACRKWQGEQEAQPQTDGLQGARYRQSPWNEPEEDHVINNSWCIALNIWCQVGTYFFLSFFKGMPPPPLL